MLVFGNYSGWLQARTGRLSVRAATCRERFRMSLATARGSDGVAKCVKRQLEIAIDDD